MKNLNPKPLAVTIFLTFALCFILVTFTGGSRVTDVWSAIKVGYKAVPLTVGIATVFVLHAWRWPIFRGWLVPFPDLNGTWQGEIQTTWKEPAAGKALGPIPVILTVKQSFVNISCVMRTAEMTSRSFLADFWLDAGEQMRKFGYLYMSTPLPSFAHRSQPHSGTIVFEVIGDPVKKLKGIYWTDRRTTGEVSLTFRGRKLLEEFPTDLGKHPVSDKN